MQKLNILFNTEFSQSSSGYSKLARELISRLHKTGKYELAELAGYLNADDPRIDDVPWKIYPTMPSRGSKPSEIAEYNSHPENPLGRWKFNETCLDFEPDVVFTYRDAWYETYAHYFPFRHLYHLLWWNPVDGFPLETDWLAAAIEADSCFTYTDWGYNTLKEATGAKGNILGSMPLGVNPEHFYPIFNKAGVKQHFGFKPDILVTGFVARNQPRKLIASLVEAFTIFLERSPRELSQKCFLYLHTSWPDISWNIPQLLKDYGVGNKVLFTYHCKECHTCYPIIYSDIGASCKHCGRNSAATSRSSDGVSEDDMNLIYNFMDGYFQVASNEGAAIPPMEAIACAVPTYVSEYSGTHDIIKYADAIPIKSIKLIREMESSSNRYLAMPDTEALAKQFQELYSLPEDLRRSIGYGQHLKGKNRFSWDLAAKILMEHLDTLPKKNWRAGPFRIRKPNMQMPSNITCEQACHFLCAEIIGRPELFNRYNALKNTYELMMEVTGNKPNFKHYTLEEAIDNALKDNTFYNEWESRRKAKFTTK